MITNFGRKLLPPASTAVPLAIFLSCALGMIPVEVTKLTPRVPVGHSRTSRGVRRPLEIAPRPRPAPKRAAAKRDITPVEKNDIRALGSGNYSRRHKAQQGLLAMGTDALPALRQALASASSPQTRGAIAKLISKMNMMNVMQPTYITLHLKHASVKKIIRRIAAQSHMRLTLFNNMAQMNGRFNFHETHQPFWQVMIDLQKKTSYGLERYQYGLTPNGALPLTLVGNDPAPYSIHGPFIAQATMFQRNSMLELSSNPAQQVRPSRSFSLQMLFACEPRLPVLQGGALFIDKAVTSTGKVIFKPGVDSTNIWFNPLQDGSGSGSVNFQTVRHMGRYLRVLKGHFTCVIAGKMAVLKFKRLFHPRKNSRETHGVTVVFAGLKHLNKHYTATIVLKNPAGGGPVFAVPVPPGRPGGKQIIVRQPVHSQSAINRQANYLGNTAVLTGVNSQPLVRQFYTTQFTPTSATVTVNWSAIGPPGLPAPGRPKQLNLFIPLAFQLASSPFVFRNLPLP